MSRLYPVDHPLGSACLKVKRANVHINGLKRSMRRLLDPQVTVSEKNAFEGRAKLVTVRIDPRMQLSWGLLVGDIVTNLRASLDHIAWALAQKHITEQHLALSGRDARAIQFPLCDAPDKFNRGGRNAIKHVLSSAHSAIEKFQPYNRTKWPELKLLAILNDLANADKHRVVTRTIMRARIAFGKDDPGVVMNLNKKDEMTFVAPFDAPYMSDDLELDFTFEIAVYPRPSSFSNFSISELPLIHNFIRDEVVPAFAGFFEKP